ncbi:cysteine hydrolase [Streptomyces venezuelae]|uniref:Cysteine hydrolase n=1 Tax=Streptomyces venezuelae TaxID=54571 RepID=A0A5P2CU79_STRVZ|nr:isochorismatase family protein [Streptomyces venezuelae]QES45557.1 cysteine hydrolase [Streptomyces venezuelae]
MTNQPKPTHPTPPLAPTGAVAPVQALIMVDMQTAFVAGDGAVPDAERLLERVRGLLARARESGAVVVQLQNDGEPGTSDETGTPGWEIHLPADTDRGEIVLRKTVDDGFEDSPLESLLRDAGVKELAVCGVMSEMCVRATASTALELGFRVVLPHDAHATYDIPAAEGISDVVPAATVSRVAEWTLGDEVEIVPRAADVVFTKP